MSNALMEAMMYEVPCIATRISGSEDLIEDGLNGLLVPAANVKALADAITYMLSHPAEANKMGLEARQTIVNKFTIQHIADKYIHLYHSLLLLFKNV
jgi:glycosyltransferase involved in cell wall biosynthesis